MLDELGRRAAPFAARLEAVGLEPRPTRHLRTTMERRLGELAGQ